MQYDLPVDSPLLSGFTTYLDIPYNLNDNARTYRPPAAVVGNCVFVGARNGASGVFALGAFGHRDTVVTDTTSTTIAETAHNGLYWYHNPTASFGFAAGPDITLNTADTRSEPNPESRLSWHLLGGNIQFGWRAGLQTGLNGDATWRKVVLVGNCALV